MKKNIKKVSMNESEFVDLIYQITENTINERIKNGELIRATKPTKKITVTESELKELKKKGVELLSIKRKK